MAASVEKLGNERLDAPVDLVPDLADHVQRLAGRIPERPVLVALPGIDGARVAAIHRHEPRFTPTSANTSTTAG